MSGWRSRGAGSDAEGTVSGGSRALRDRARDSGDRRASALGSGRSARRVADTSVLVVERPLRDGTIALAGRPSFVASSAELGSVPDASDTRVTLADADGRLVMGVAVPDKDYTVRLGSATGLPWTVYATSAGDPAVGPFTPRSRVVLAGVGRSCCSLPGAVTSSAAPSRASWRRAAAVRLRLGGVTRVSHAATSMRQLSEMLDEGRVADDDRRQSTTRSCGSESGRLQRLVENLLDFGRMEAGALPSTDGADRAARFVRDVVDDFRARPARRATTSILDGAPAAASTRDREALRARSGTCSTTR